MDAIFYEGELQSCHIALKLGGELSSIGGLAVADTPGHAHLWNAEFKAAPHCVNPTAEECRHHLARVVSDTGIKLAPARD